MARGSRWVLGMIVLLLAANLWGCEEGEAVVIDPGGGDSNIAVVIEPAVPEIGCPATVTVTVTDDSGNAVAQAQVSYSTFPTGSAAFIPNPDTTTVAGRSITNMSTVIGETPISGFDMTVTVTSESATSTVKVNLNPGDGFC